MATEELKNAIKHIIDDHVVTFKEFEHVMDGFVSFLQKAKVEFQDDPDSRNLERHYQQYSTLIIETTEALRRIQDSLPSGFVYQKQRRMYDAVRPFCEGSVIFRRALDKPLGYPGDFLLLLYRIFAEYMSIRLRATNDELINAKKRIRAFEVDPV